MNRLEGTITKAEAIERIQGYDEDIPVCPECLSEMRKSNEGEGEFWQCGNETCENTKCIPMPEPEPTTVTSMKVINSDRHHPIWKGKLDLLFIGGGVEILWQDIIEGVLTIRVEDNVKVEPDDYRGIWLKVAK